MKKTFSNQQLRAIAFALVSAICAPAIQPVSLCAQEQAAHDPRAGARKLRDAGNFAGAISLLRSHLSTHPNDGDALRLLAETLYWNKDFAGAREVSERALRLHPEDTELRIQFARELIETGFGTRAREVLAPVGSPATGGRADAILGTLAYWEGDLAGADKLISSAIASGDKDSAIRRIHTDIAVLTAPWLGVTAGYQHDDQPINRSSIQAVAGWFPVASTSVAVHAAGNRFKLGDTATRVASLADVTLSHYAAAAHTEFEVAAGGVTRSFGASSDFVGSASIALRLPNHLKLGVNAFRSPYFATEASLSQSVMTNTLVGSAKLDHPLGWLGEAAYQHQRYEDSNALTSAYIWLLAPLIHSAEVTLRAGYSGSLQTSSENRFALTRPSQPYPPGDARFDLTGTYQPYYTPDNFQSHSAIASVETHYSPAVSFSADGAYAFRATEAHPVLVVVGTGTPRAPVVQRLSYVRTFNPWNAHASVQLKPSADVSFVADGYLFRTGFYSASGASLAFVYHFASRAIGQAGGY